MIRPSGDLKARTAVCFMLVEDWELQKQNKTIKSRNQLIQAHILIGSADSVSQCFTSIFFPLGGVKERAQEQCVRETCEASLLLSLHPRSSLTLVLQELHNDGSVSFSHAARHLQFFFCTAHRFHGSKAKFVFNFIDIDN